VQAQTWQGRELGRARREACATFSRPAARSCRACSSAGASAPVPPGAAPAGRGRPAPAAASAGSSAPSARARDASPRGACAAASVNSASRRAYRSSLQQGRRVSCGAGAFSAERLQSRQHRRHAPGARARRVAVRRRTAATSAGSRHERRAVSGITEQAFCAQRPATRRTAAPSSGPARARARPARTAGRRTVRRPAPPAAVPRAAPARRPGRPARPRAVGTRRRPRPRPCRGTAPAAPRRPGRSPTCRRRHGGGVRAAVGGLEQARMRRQGVHLRSPVPAPCLACTLREEGLGAAHC